MLISLNFPSFVSILQSKPLTSSADNLTPANEDYNNIFFEQKIEDVTSGLIPYFLNKK